MRKTISTTAVQEAREKDTAERPKRKEVRAKRIMAQEKMVKPKTKVLVAQRKTTTKPPSDPNPYTVTEVKGTQVRSLVTEQGTFCGNFPLSEKNFFLVIIQENG